jgi:hypothetical protein
LCSFGDDVGQTTHLSLPARAKPLKALTGTYIFAIVIMTTDIIIIILASDETNVNNKMKFSALVS